MILDFIMLIVVVLFIRRGYRRGIARMVFSLLRTGVSLVIAYLAGRWLSNYIYSTYVLPAVSASIQNSMKAQGVGADKIAQNILTDIPFYAGSVFSHFGISQSSISNVLASSSDNSVQGLTNAVDRLVSPLLITVFAAVLFVLIFILCFVLLGFIGKKALSLFKLPVIRQANKFIGAFAGLLEGALFVCAGILVLAMVLPYSQSAFIPPDIISDSALFKAVYNSGLVSNLTNVKV